MILDKPQKHWTRVTAAQWFTFDNNKLIFNEDGSMIIPKNTVAYVYNTSYFRINDHNLYIRIIGDTYEGYDLFVNSGDYDKRNISNLEVGKNVIIYDGYPYVHSIMPTVNDVKINYIDYVYLSDIPPNLEPGWVRYDMSDLNSAKNVLSENGTAILYDGKTFSSETIVVPIKWYVGKTTGEPPYLELMLFEYKNLNQDNFNTEKKQLLLKRSGNFKIVGRTRQFALFNNQPSLSEQQYNVNINRIPYYDSFYWKDGNQKFNKSGKVIAMINSTYNGYTIGLTDNYPHSPYELVYPAWNKVERYSFVDILYIDEYIGKISEIEFNIDFDKVQLGTFIEIKCSDIKVNGVSISNKNPIVKYWTNDDKTVRVFDKEVETFGDSTDLYFQIECDGYETSDIIHKELKIMNIDGFQGSYNGGVVGYANHINDNYKTTEARILIPLTNTSFISYKK